MGIFDVFMMSVTFVSGLVVGGLVATIWFTRDIGKDLEFHL